MARYKKAGYKNKKRTQKRFNPVEVKKLEFTSSSVFDPEVGKGSALTPTAETATGAGTWAGYSRASGGTKPNAFEEHIQFGSRSAVVEGVAGTVLQDGSWPIALVPSVGTSYNEYLGRKFYPKKLLFKGCFFTTATGSGTTYNTLDQWDSENFIKVLLVCEKDCSRKNEVGATPTYFEGCTAAVIYNAEGASHTQVQRDGYVNALMNLDKVRNIQILKTWSFELSSGAQGAEASLPFTLLYHFKGGHATEGESTRAVTTAYQGRDLRRNRYTLLYIARGAVAVQYEGRLSFCDG